MQIVLGDITALRDVEAIVNASNGVGPMGRGVAGAIARAAGKSLKDHVQRVCDAAGGFEAGEFYVSVPGELLKQGIRIVYHAVTMKYPGSPSSLAVIESGMRKVLENAIEKNIKSIAFPGLGTGIGGLNKDTVAASMVSLAELYSDRINVTIIDLDEDFINYAKKRQQTD